MASRRVLPLDLPALDSLSQPLYHGALGGDVNHVVAVEARDWDEWNGLWVVADLLDEVAEVSLMISLNRSSDHLVVSILLMATDELLDAQECRRAERVHESDHPWRYRLRTHQ